MREIIEVNARPHDVIEFLRLKQNTTMNLKDLDTDAKRVILHTDIGFLSWGEKIEVVVQAHNEGSRIVIIGEPINPLNLTSNVDGAVKKLITILLEHFER